MTQAMLLEKGFEQQEEVDGVYYALEVYEEDQIDLLIRAVELEDDGLWEIADGVRIQCREDFSEAVLFIGDEIYPLNEDGFEDIVENLRAR